MRQAWVMKLKPGHEAIYKKKHDEIWPEMVAMMKRDGVRNYSIYRHGLLLFAYLERDSAGAAVNGTLFFAGAIGIATESWHVFVVVFVILRASCCKGACCARLRRGALQDWGKGCRSE